VVTNAYHIYSPGMLCAISNFVILAYRPLA